MSKNSSAVIYLVFCRKRLFHNRIVSLLEKVVGLICVLKCLKPKLILVYINVSKYKRVYQMYNAKCNN